jgi:glycosyltransferase involved in cell wall biosynthesis
MRMRFSVIIPCYNAGRWIGQTLASLAAQTLPPHEVFVIDDGSSDDSIEQVKKSGVAVTLLRTQRANGAGARNAGIRAASGDWIALLDADDLWYPSHLARAAELLGRSNDVAFMSNHDWIDLEKNVTPIPPSLQCKLLETRTGLTARQFLEIYVQGFHFGHSTVVYNRQRVIDVGLFDETQLRRHDLDLWLRVIRDHTWTWDAVKSMGYRKGTPGSISKSVVSCEYYALRALVKNREGFEGSHWGELADSAARRAMSLAFMDGDRSDFDLARELSWPYLPGGYRLFYGMASTCPGLFRAAVKMKRWLRPLPTA